MIIMCQCSSSVVTTDESYWLIDNGGGYVYMGARGIWKISAQFSCEPKRCLKKNEVC